MDEEKEDELPWGKWLASFWSLPLFLAILCTGIWGWVVWSIAFEPTPFLIFFDGPTSWELFWEGKPNEMGDTLAGLTGVLVMIWVIASTFLQRSELRQARDEYTRMANAMDEQSKVAQAQIKILESEQVQREQNIAQAELDQRLEGLVFKATTASAWGGAWIEGARGTMVHRTWRLLDISRELECDEFLRMMHENIAIFAHEVPKKARISSITAKPGLLEKCAYQGFLDEISETLLLVDRLGADQIVRLKNLKLKGTEYLLQELLNADIWETEESK